MFYWLIDSRRSGGTRISMGINEYTAVGRRGNDRRQGARWRSRDRFVFSLIRNTVADCDALCRNEWDTEG